MRVPLLDLARELRHIGAEVKEQWDKLLKRPQFINGEQVRCFETEMAAFLSVPHVVGTASGTEALILGLAACGIGEGDEVILPANAFVAALEAVWWLKARPVLVDVQDWDLGPNPEQIRRRLTRKTKALIVVHLYGMPVNLDPLLEICRAAGIHLIEDCSHAPGAIYQGKRVGGFGTVGCFSAGVVKNLGAYGEAGFVATQEAAIARQLKLLRGHGQEEKNVHLCYGTNGRLDELQAAVLRIKLRSLDERNARRREIARLYTEAFASLELTPPWEDQQRTGVYHQYVIRTRQRDALRAHLRERGIETGIHYPTPLHMQPAWQGCYRQTLSFPRAEHAAQEILSLPVFPDLSQAEIDTVIGEVRSFFARDSRQAIQPQLSLTVGHLSIISIFVASILIGLADDRVVYFLSRYEEERDLGRSFQEAIHLTFVHAGPGIVAAAGTNALVFYAMMLSDFRGIQELGFIAGNGMLLFLVMTLTFLPALLTLTEGKKQWQQSMRRDTWLAGGFTRLERAVQRLRRPVLLVAAAVSLLCLLALPTITFDYNLLHLQARGTESVTWERRIIDHSGRSSWFALATASSLMKAAQKAARFEALPSVETREQRKRT